MSEIKKLPILDLSRAFKDIHAEVSEAVERVLNSQAFILGPEVKNFETHVENYLDLQPENAIGCASGSDALLLALMALDLKPGDEVITTPFTFFATASAITRLGARPVFVDVDPATYNIDLNQALNKINNNTKVFLPVHLFGQTVPIEKIYDELKSRDIKIVEDAAQSFGAWRKVNGSIARAGVMGDVGCYSFFPTKNLGACGDGGMIVTRDAKLAARLRKLRVHGEGSTYYHEEVGLNSRLDAIQAAILDVKLKYLESWNKQRRELAANYKNLFNNYNLNDFITPPSELEDNYHIYHQYVIRVKDRRDELMQYLEANNFITRVYYPLCLHMQTCFKFLNYKPGDFPTAEKLSSEVLALPIFPGLLSSEQERLVSKIKEFFK
ncbi:MAG: DegT/DnrJ/EryC1/StrS family aminotransferase [Synergistaceae bacterium]|nr:DegT/DnrJ/EryC1/StrS family aminotransferase [Synergistaceae bacterium]